MEVNATRGVCVWIKMKLDQVLRGYWMCLEFQAEMRRGGVGLDGETK